MEEEAEIHQREVYEEEYEEKSSPMKAQRRQQDEQ